MELKPAVTQIALKLDQNISEVLSSEKLKGFEKAYLVAEATAQLKLALTPEYMKPIMPLQGSKLGFKTDKDDEGGYPEAVVKNCLIEAVLTGVQPTGNQFNIIASNCYITKEGFKELLSKVPGLDYEIIPQLPRINPEKTSAAIVMKVEWTIGGKTSSKDLDIPVRMNAKMGTDAVIGKATRKARAWLYNRITGLEVGDGDVMDTEGKVVSSTINTPDPREKQIERMRLLINSANTIADLDRIAEKVPEELLDLFTVRKDELKGK